MQWLDRISENLIIFEGLHPFYLSRQRQLYDLKIFIKPEKDLANHWKIIRDTLKRGYTKEKVLKTLQDREQDSKDFIESQSKYADILKYFLLIYLWYNLRLTKERCSERFLSQAWYSKRRSFFSTNKEIK